MTSKLSGVVFVAASLAATYALASGYGPAPHYKPSTGAPASQQGMNMQTIAADEAAPQRNNDETASKDKQDSPLIQAQD
ncbi:MULTISPECIES: hypothetical protein [unclassified Caballeronia]|uniref:hypothetical protein n=1 Tax=unclassified Caballeronia TaxID=2646786 RepID=UPI002857F048|nr:MULTISPECIES: hypothetical protein [unclassified Caballeronia]MDR5739932.1 hypothetical protein [Caballeronia sp. LZ016]MDR5807325.1 hypothetical protein [Caballeronia sp. LZ019]